MESEPDCMHVSGLTANKVLKRLAAPVIEETRCLYEQGDGSKVERFHSFRYKARSWSRKRRVIVKVDVGPLGTNVRFIVSDMEDAPARILYQKIYCNRARAENFIKDHKLYLHSDRASCHRFEANQFRLFLHSLAYILFDTLRREVLRGTRVGEFYNRDVAPETDQSGSARARAQDKDKDRASNGVSSAGNDSAKLPAPGTPSPRVEAAVLQLEIRKRASGNRRVGEVHHGATNRVVFKPKSAS